MKKYKVIRNSTSKLLVASSISLAMMCMMVSNRSFVASDVFLPKKYEENKTKNFTLKKKR